MNFADKSKGEPQSLKDFKAKQRALGLTPHYEQLDSTWHQRILHDLIAEQGGRCCYCGTELIERKSVEVEGEDSVLPRRIGYHIEHFWPQKPFTDRTLDHDNIFASCGTGSNTERCGDAKGNLFCAKHKLLPSTPGCEDRFDYHVDGQMKPADGVDDDGGDANRIIKHLKLSGTLERGDRGYASGKKQWRPVVTERASRLKGYKTHWYQTRPKTDFEDLIKSAQSRNRDIGFANVEVRFLRQLMEKQRQFADAPIYKIRDKRSFKHNAKLANQKR